LYLGHFQPSLEGRIFFETPPWTLFPANFQRRFAAARTFIVGFIRNKYQEAFFPNFKNSLGKIKQAGLQLKRTTRPARPSQDLKD